MNNMNVFWHTHIKQMPSDEFTFIHPQALQIVGNPINGWKKKNNIAGMVNTSQNRSSKMRESNY